MCLIAGDISPIDVITPLPVLCEDNDVPYIYVPSKVGSAAVMLRVYWVLSDGCHGQQTACQVQLLPAIGRVAAIPPPLTVAHPLCWRRRSWAPRA